MNHLLAFFEYGSEVWRRCLRGNRLPLVDFRASYVIDSGGISKKGAMSELRQRLLPIARQPLALMGFLRALCASAGERAKILAEQPAIRRIAARFKFYPASLRRSVERWKRESGLGGRRSEPGTWAPVKRSEGGM